MDVDKTPARENAEGETMRKAHLENGIFTISMDQHKKTYRWLHPPLQ